MNQRPFALTAIFFIVAIVELLLVITTAEPTNRHHRGLIVNKNLVAVDCTADYSNSPQCRTKSVNRNGGETIYVEKHGDGDGDNKRNEDKDKLTNIMQLPDDNDDNDNDNVDDGAVDEGRGRKKKKGMGKMLFILAAAMKGTLLYAMIHGVAILAGKALVVAKVALALAAAVALKKALEHPDKTSYEIVKHPQHSYSQTHSSSVDYDHHGGFEGHRRRRKR